MKLGKDAIEQLLWHYHNILSDTNLLAQTASENGMSLREQFESVMTQIEKLQEELKSA